MGSPHSSVVRILTHARRRTRGRGPRSLCPMAFPLSPSAPLRLKTYSTLRLLSLCSSSFSKSRPFPLPASAAAPRRPFPPSAAPRRGCFCTAIAAALRSSEAVEARKPEPADPTRGEFGGRVGEFRKRLRISEIKGGADEGLGLVGRTLTVMGWVRTLRAQSSVTFIEVMNDSVGELLVRFIACIFCGKWEC